MIAFMYHNSESNVYVCRDETIVLGHVGSNQEAIDAFVEYVDKYIDSILATGHNVTNAFVGKNKTILSFDVIDRWNIKTRETFDLQMFED